VWSVLSLIALLGGIGLLLAVFGRWSFLGWHGMERQTISFRPPDRVRLTPAQRSCAWFFLAMALLFLLQTLVGAASQHYRADLQGFFGVDLARILPFNLARTWHVQLAIFWVATSYLAAGIFLAPMIVGQEPRGQHWLAFGLLGALVVVVFGSLAGEMAGVWGWFREAWIWFGHQGFEYLDLGRFWQVLLIAGLGAWPSCSAGCELGWPRITWATCPGCFSFLLFPFPPGHDKLCVACQGRHRIRGKDYVPLNRFT
jgi:nitric oxide reductase subunit B